MGILFTTHMGFLFTITMGILFTIVLGIQFTISTRKRILCIPTFGPCRNRHIFTLFGMQPAQKRRSTGSLRDDAKLSKEKYSSCLGDRLQEILKLSSKRSQDSQELPQGKA